MSDDNGWGPRSDETPWEWTDRLLRQLWRCLVGPPPELTGPDLVPEGALPICPECVLPHHPFANYCPECGAIVNRYAAWFPLPYIWIWGRAFQRLAQQRRVSRLVWAGAVLAAILWLAPALLLYVAMCESPASSWPDRLQHLQVLLIEAITFLAGLKLLQTAIRTWGTWREEDACDNGPTPAAQG